MSDTVTFDRLRDIIAETLKVDKEKVTPEASFQDDLKADSLERHNLAADARLATVMASLKADLGKLVLEAIGLDGK